MKYVKYILAVLIVIVTVTAIGLEPKKVSKSDYLLDTYITINAYGNHAEQAVDAALLRVRDIDRSLNAFSNGSEVFRINASPAGTAVSVSEDCFFLLKKAKELAEKTEGAYDFTVKPLMDLWGFGQQTPAVPEQAQREKTLEKVDYTAVVLDEEHKTVTLLKEGMAIDLGGIAKGYAADEAAKVLKAHGVENAYLDFGGNVVTLGARPLGLWERITSFSSMRPFTVGIQNPTATRGTVIETVTANAPYVSVVTSGGYERYFEENGKRYHHILNPKTGLQPKNGVLSVTVIGNVSCDCDVLSTALFVLGPDKAETLSDCFQQAIFVMEDGSVKKFGS